MTDANGQPISLDANVLEGTSDGLQITYQTSDGQTVTTIASSNDAADIVSRAFTTVAEGAEPNVEYITMTPEEAAAAGVVTQDDDQVMTTSLQFDPANPSVLYTADGTPINQADLSPEEQALVQAALQQHLAEQEAEQQLALIQESSTSSTQATETTTSSADGNLVTSTSLIDQAQTATTTSVQATSVDANGSSSTVNAAVNEQTDTTVTSSVATSSSTPISALGDGIDLASPSTSASQIVQSLADNVRKQQLQDHIEKETTTPVITSKPLVPKSTMRGGEGSAAGGIKYEEKIVIRQGQPQVVKVPVKKKPEIPAALANLMPKVEISKDGSQVIRIHQSQITSQQLKALQDNPNVRLVFRPASGSRPSSVKSPAVGLLDRPRKRGRPRKVQLTGDPGVKYASEAVNKDETEIDLDDPPAKTRCGRLSKRPVYTKDYLTPKLSQGMDDGEGDHVDMGIDMGDISFTPKSVTPLSPKKPRGRPPGSINKFTAGNKNFKRTNSYASKIEALRAQESTENEVAVPSKPALTPIEQAISTRRKNRLRELLSACSEDEIMEVALPHLARVFSLWEFLITKVEKNKMTRVFFADVYKEYECLHKYVSKLAEKYKQAIESSKVPASDTTDTTTGEENGIEKEEKANDEEEKAEEKGDKKFIAVNFKKLAESLGLDTTTLEDAEIQLLDPEEAIGPRLMGMGTVPMRQRSTGPKFTDDKNMRKVKQYVSSPPDASVQIKSDCGKETAKPIQTEATSTISQIPAETSNNNKTVGMPPLKPLGNQTKLTAATTTTTSTSQPDDSTETTQANIPQVNGSGDAQEKPVTADGGDVSQITTEASTEAMQTDAVAVTAGGEGGTGTQLIQIGQGEDQQFIEVPEGYTLIQTPEGLVMSQPGTTISQGDDGTIYITHADGNTTPLNAAQQQGVPLETVESLLSLDGQQQQS